MQSQMKTTQKVKSFDFRYDIFKDGVKIHLVFTGNKLNTSEYPDIYTKLLGNLPTVLSTECLNPKNLPFSEEVGQTEVGHLFEHLLLEYMALNKEKFVQNFTIAGRTFWSARNNKPNEFTVEIYCHLCDFPIFQKSLLSTCDLLNFIISDRGGLPVASVMPN
jgi:hypothetical protein